MTADIISKILEKGYDLVLGEGDRITIERNPDKLIDLLRAYKNMGNAESRTIREFGYSGRNDITDAFRHALWNALMVRDIGDAFVIEIANNHEMNENKPEENRMDLWNNKLGRDIGNRLKEQSITDDDAYAEEILKNKDKLVTLK